MRFMLIGGIDVSGNRYEGQNNHAALVIGKKDAISRIYNKIGMREIHISIEMKGPGTIGSKYHR